MILGPELLYHEHICPDKNKRCVEYILMDTSELEKVFDAFKISESEPKSLEVENEIDSALGLSEEGLRQQVDYLSGKCFNK